MWVEETVIVGSAQGLHARPARMLWEKARRFGAEIRIRKGKHQFDAKSIFDIMALDAVKGTELTVCARGEKAEEAVKALADLIRRDLDKPE